MDQAKMNKRSRIRTGVYSGSFNPIHIGHLALANWLCEYGGLDEIWFLITPHNPLKEREGLMDDRLRLELAEMSIASYPKFKVSDFEFSLPKPTYTIDTLSALRVTHPEREFYFIMGADNWAMIDQWKDYQELIREYKILVYPRKGYEAHIPETCPNVCLAEAPVMEISSTFIRESYEAGKDVRFFLPEAIRSYFIPYEKRMRPKG